IGCGIAYRSLGWSLGAGARWISEAADAVEWRLPAGGTNCAATPPRTNAVAQRRPFLAQAVSLDTEDIGASTPTSPSATICSSHRANHSFLRVASAAPSIHHP